MAAGMVASRSLRDLLTRRLTASSHPGLSISLRLTGSSAQQEASGVALGEAPDHSYESLRVTSVQKHVLHVQLNRPDKRNAMNRAFWRSDLQILEACLHGEVGAAGLGESGTWAGEMDMRTGYSHPICSPLLIASQRDGRVLQQDFKRR
ncbi:putative enoyl CoA hydratase [Saguinus oedipus]|uniref:Enoyl CoA hydratase n=1 Tax=Saguinus oedipus TaxID=9490 RepID=A0ABQ9TUB6_SAGOE|nr:putative enoyl CoA hydratase [Saguinus oedipus]